MMERARKRREILNSKMAEINATPQRKRGPPLSENQTDNMVNSDDDNRLLNDSEFIFHSLVILKIKTMIVIIV
jgi:hypothetical protein